MDTQNTCRNTTKLLAATLVLLLALPALAQQTVAPGRQIFLHREHPLNRGLLAWFKVIPANAAGLYWFDLTGRYFGLLSLTTTGLNWGSTTRPGGQGELRFDGTDDYVGVTGMFGEPPVITMSVWARLITTDTNEAKLVTLGDCVSIQIDKADNSSEAQYHFSGGYRGAVIASTFAGTGWHLFTFVLNPPASELKFFVDGVLRSTFSSSAAIVYTGCGATDTRFGMHATGAVTSSFNGSMDDIRVWDRVLSDAEVLEMYRLSRQGDGPLIRSSPFLPRGFIGFVVSAINKGGFFRFFR